MQMATVQKEVGPVVVAEGSLRLGDLVVVVRELEVDAARVDVDLRAKDGAAHGRALDVPAGTTPPPRRLPSRLARLRPLPQRKVGGVQLL